LKKSEARRVATARAFIFDMDGTLVLGSATGGGFAPLPGAVDLLAALRARGTPFRVFTNGTAKIPKLYAAALREAGLPVRDEEMMTPATAAADWFVRRNIKRVRALGGEGLQGPLIEAGLEVIAPSETAAGVEAVFTGWYKEFSLADMELACRDIWAGARLTSSSNVPFFATAGGGADRRGGRRPGAGDAPRPQCRRHGHRRHHRHSGPPGAARCACRRTAGPGARFA
jgi:ribonucleotide monophosphatase NagD (HAD superfamily)